MYAESDLEFASLRTATLAQWILESGWGTSALAVEHRNYGGLKWRPEMADFATPVVYNAHDGPDRYCKFASHEAFIRGYWRFIERAPYVGWRNHAHSGEAFLRFIGPIYAGDKKYVDKVLALLPEAEDLLASSDADLPELHCCEEMNDEFEMQGLGKPKVDRFEPTEHRSSRDATKIDHVVLHYTTSRNIEGTISHFKKGVIRDGKHIRTSARYVIGQDGELVQMVNESHAAWHSGSSDMNKRSIGIEHVAAPGDRLTEPQERTSLQLLHWLLTEYNIPRRNVVPHDSIKATSCPGDLFRDFGEDHAAAIQTWLEKRLPNEALVS